MRLCDALFPLLRNNAKVVNVSSSAGHLTRIPSDRRQADLGDPTLTVEKLNALVKQFLK